MVAKARELAEKHGWFLCRQFENEANADIHSAPRRAEILAAFDGRRLDYWVTGAGTGGTLKGVARVLKAERPGRRGSSSASPTTRRCSAAASPRHRRPTAARPPSATRCSGPHLMQGWTPDFIPKLTRGRARRRPCRPDRRPSTAPTRCGCARELARQEGIFCGISGGATLAGALRGRRRRAAGRAHPLHAARHRRALPLDAAVRGHPRGR